MLMTNILYICLIQETYPYYHLPYCKPDHGIDTSKRATGIGEMLEGNELRNSGFKLHFPEDVKTEDVCDMVRRHHPSHHYDDDDNNNYHHDRYNYHYHDHCRHHNYKYYICTDICIGSQQAGCG